MCPRDGRLALLGLKQVKHSLATGIAVHTHVILTAGLDVRQRPNRGKRPRRPGPPGAAHRIPRRHDPAHTHLLQVPDMQAEQLHTDERPFNCTVLDDAIPLGS